jgi:hybrid cluster-associated redox disulfide protein
MKQANERPPMSEPAIGPDSIVGAVMDAYPETVAVFVRRRMQCPGCVMSPFMTMSEVAKSYAVDSDDLIADLRAALAAAGRRP